MMNLKKLQTRDSSLDIIRIVAVFTVVSVHFFLNNGFYSQPVIGWQMYIAVLMRTLFTVCVPLFMILTGYLMSKKTLSKQYYSGITKTLVVFVISTIACMVFKHIQFQSVLDFKSVLLGTLDFSGSTYSWYIEMYIGLFLLAPFLNLAYNKLETQGQKQALVGTLVALTIVPTFFNMFNFQSGAWWANPTSSDEFQKLMPSWWISFYPVAYYFTGCYIREFGFKVKTRTLFVLFVFVLFAFGSFNFYRSYNTTFKSGMYIYWYGFESYLLSVFMFILLKRIKTECCPNGLKMFLWKVSDLALGTYLISYIFDTLFYKILNEAVPSMPDKLPYYFLIVPAVFIASALASWLMNFIAHWAIVGYKKLVEFIKEQRQRDDKSKWQLITFIALMSGAVVFAFWKCAYGFGGNDEAFYLTIPHRLTLGDAFITDEWHLSQLSGFLTMPFVWIYTAIAHGTDGILLAARILYVVFHAAITCVIYSRLRKHGYIAAIGCVLYFIFTPYDIMAMSYNTMGLDLIALTGVLLGTANYEKKAAIIISGVSFAGAVLCCPYLAIGYVLFALGVAARLAIRKTKLNKNVFSTNMFSLKTFLWFTVGVAGLAVIFLIFLLTRVSFGEIMNMMPHLLTDPEHPQLSFTVKMNFYFKTIWECQEFFKYALIAYGVILAAMIIDRKRKMHRSIYLILTTFVVIFSFVLFLPQMQTVYYNAIMYPMLFLGLTSYILTENKSRTLMASLFALGFIYSVALCFSSNQYFYVTAMAASASNIASFVFIAQLVKEMNESNDNLDYPRLCKYTSFALVAFVIFLQGAFQIDVKANHCFWESAPKDLTTTISAGPAKGIITTADNAEVYRQINEDLDYYKTKTPDNILCLTARTWTYLALDNYPYGTLSAWITGEKPESIERLNDYYSVNPEKKPKYIYIPKNSQWDFTEIHTIAQSKGYTVEENDVSYKLEKP